MKSRICLLGLNRSFNNKTAINLAKKLDMFFADIDELVEYEIINPSQVEATCGKEYLQKLQRGCVKRASSFENSILTMNYYLLNDDVNLQNVRNNCLIIYLKLSKDSYTRKNRYNKIDKLKNILDDFVFDERNKICEQIADITIDVSNKSYLQASNLVKEKLLEYYNL